MSCFSKDTRKCCNWYIAFVSFAMFVLSIVIIIVGIVQTGRNIPPESKNFGININI